MTGPGGPFLLHAVAGPGTALPADAARLRPGLARRQAGGVSLLLSPLGPGEDAALATAEGAAALALAHHGLLAALLSDLDLAPIRFPTLAGTAAAAVAGILAEEARHRATLAHVAGAVELALRVEAAPERASAPAEAPPAPADGRGYLRAAAEARNRARAAAETRARALERLAAPLRALARDVRATARPAPGRVLDLALLLPRAALAEAQALVAAGAAELLAGTGLAARLSGPWPAYSFAGEAA